MGALKTAGILSGLGQGLGKGLEQMQSGIIQQGLMQQRFEHDDAAANVEREFQMRKQREQQEYDRGARQEKGGMDIALHTGDRVAAAEQNKLKMDADVKLHEGDRAATATESEKKRTFEGAESDKKMKAEIGEKAKDRALKREELAEYREYHKGLVARANTVRPSLPPEQKARLDILTQRSKELEERARKFSEMADKSMDDVRKDEFQDKATEAFDEQKLVHESMEELFNLKLPQAKPSAGTTVKDRFGKSPLTQGK